MFIPFAYVCMEKVINIFDLKRQFILNVWTLIANTFETQCHLNVASGMVTANDFLSDNITVMHFKCFYVRRLFK